MERDFLIDLFADFGPVAIRRMFSALRHIRRWHQFRAGAARRPLFPCRRTEHSAVRGGRFKTVFVSTRAKTITVNSYWQLPARLFDDSEELADWARTALAAAQRAALRKRPKVRKAKKRVKNKAA